MSRDCRFAILSDVHYAGTVEQKAGDDYEVRALPNPLLRFLLGLYRHHVWLRHPLRQNGQLDRFLAGVGPVDFAVANGDYACNVAALGVSDGAALQSARECLDKLRAQFDGRLLANFGDHELGKRRLLGTRGGLRLESWHRAIAELALPGPASSWAGPGELRLVTKAGFWKLVLGHYVLLNVVSTLLALPLFAGEMLPEEKSGWEELRERHLAQIRSAFVALQPGQRVLLFCHDPTALPFLWQDETIRRRLPHIEQTIIGHLHSDLFLQFSKVLSGMPVIGILGSSVRKLSAALNQAHLWQPFRVRLCPSLAGIELLKDGGYYTAELDPEALRPVQFHFHSLPRKSRGQNEGRFISPGQ